MTVGVAAAAAVLTWLETPGLNGSSFWVWRWRSEISLALPGPVTVYAAMLAAAAPLLAAIAIFRPQRGRTAAALALATLATLLLIVGARLIEE